MADLKIIVGARLDQKQAQKDLAAQLKKIKNLSVRVNIISDSKEVLQSVKEINQKILNAFKENEQAQTKAVQAEAMRRMEIRKMEEEQAKRTAASIESANLRGASQSESDGKSSQTVSQRLMNGANRLSQWITGDDIASTAANLVKDMFVQVKSLDDSLTQLQNVSDLSGASLESFTDKAFLLGSQIGRTGQEVIDATTTFKRAGYTLDESLNLAESALVMTNISGTIQDTGKAASYLISVLEGFNMSDTEATTILDMMNETSNNASIGFENLAQGLQDVSSTMSDSGNSLSETIGLLTGGFGELRDIDTVSSGKQQAPYVQKCA